MRLTQPPWQLQLLFAEKRVQKAKQLELLKTEAVQSSARQKNCQFTKSVSVFLALSILFLPCGCNSRWKLTNIISAHVCCPDHCRISRKEDEYQQAWTTIHLISPDSRISLSFSGRFTRPKTLKTCSSDAHLFRRIFRQCQTLMLIQPIWMTAGIAVRKKKRTIKMAKCFSHMSEI